MAIGVFGVIEMALGTTVSIGKCVSTTTVPVVRIRLVSANIKVTLVDAVRVVASMTSKV